MKCKKFYEERKETPFTPAISLFFALDEALKLILEEGLEKRIERHRDCAKTFYKSLKALGLDFFAHPDFRSNTVIAVKNPAGIEDKDIRKIMRSKYGIEIAGGMGRLKGTMFRIGNMGIVCREYVAATVDALQKTLSELGYI